ncbi:stalk domain-containing protein [Paenibacillus sp. FJAT-27812]|uniref:stalk domain-containing protein n=1 Tax=Paenibacillus sp. FJAT-27812 TaxID=1684143 RepID=UPI0009EC65D5|nr:stalk domain-containing protein [Paenibacillus sp. FJAT-27812]
MIRFKFRRSTIAGMTVALAATLLNSIPVSAEDQTTRKNLTPLAANQALQDTSANVVFLNLPISFPLPPRFIKGTIMVPGKALLEGLGYKTKWQADERKLVAEQENKPTLVFWAGLAQAEINGKKITGPPVASFIDQQVLWIPLRLAAEASGLRVTWDAANRYAIVTDPLALPRFSVMTKIDNGLAESPLKMLEYMKQTFKLDVDFVQVGPEYYRQKTMVMIAAGDPTALMLLEDPYVFQDELMSSFSIDLTKDLEDYPRLKELALTAPGSRVIDGKIYGVPRPGDPHNASFPAIRKDWLDKLGLIQPQTMEELYEVLKRFTSQDPDGNGKHDTIGLTGYTNEFGLGTLSWVEHAFTGNPARFTIKDGKVIDYAVSTEETQALQWLARAFKDGLLDKEFAAVSMQQVSDRLRSNKAGLAALNINEAAALTGDDSVWLPLTTVKASSTSVPIAPWNTQGNGTYIVSKNSKLGAKQILAWLDHGIEKTESGGWDTLKDWQLPDQQAVNSLFGQSDMLKRNSSLDSLPAAIRSEYEAAIKSWKKISYSTTSLPEASSLLQTGQYVEFNRELEQLKLKVIMGESTIEDWTNFISKYTASADYKAMLVEMNQRVSTRVK